MLQNDGLEVSFVHRSFQEYFAARFATSLSQDKMRTVLDKYSERWDDSVIPMLQDMHREPFEQQWVIPTIEKYERILGTLLAGSNPMALLRTFFSEMIIGRLRKSRSVGVGFLSRPDLYGPLVVLVNLYPHHFPGSGFPLLLRAWEGKPYEQVVEALTKQKNSENKGYQKIVADAKEGLPLEINLEEDWDWEGFDITEGAKDVQQGLRGLRSEIEARSRNRDTILADVLGL